jgi:PAS domain S-box-containing protein
MQAQSPPPMNSPSTTAPQTSAADRIDLQLSADPRRILADRVEQLYSQLPIAIGATIVAGAFATWELQGRWLTELVFYWGAIVAAYTVAATSLLIAYRRSSDKIDKAEQWLRSLGIAALANGVSWGLAGAVFFRSLTDEQQVFLSFLFAGISSIGIPVYAASWPIFAIYAAGILLPFTYVLATIGSRLFLDIAVLVPVLYLVYVGIAYRLHQVFSSGYRLRHAYGKLTEDHIALNRRLEQQLVELSEARRQVEASGRKLALFSERSPIAVFEFDPEGRVLTVNPAAETLFGYSSREMTGRPGTETLFPGEAQGDINERWRSLIQSREAVFGLRLTNTRRDGAEIICEWNLTPLINPENRVISVIVQGRDITQQLEAERMKQEFTSTLSHELRTPLTSIIGSLQLINSGVMGEIDKDTLELTTIAERNGQRLLDLINDILDAEKIESGKLTLFPEVLDLGELVNESLALNRGFADRFKVRLATAGELLQVRVNADRKRLLQVMTNLLSNAAKFSPEGGVVEVTMENVDGNNVRVDVHDCGPGIPEGFHDRIFGRFAQADMSYTRQKGGTGLGLSICKRLIEMMGGRIGFSGREGGGTIFWFELPRQA